MSQPGGSSSGDPNSPAGGAPSQGMASDQMGNQLQDMLAQLMQACQALGQQNTIIQPEMMEASAAIRKAFIRTVSAAGPPQPQQAAPPA